MSLISARDQRASKKHAHASLGGRARRDARGAGVKIISAIPSQKSFHVIVLHIRIREFSASSVTVMLSLALSVGETKRTNDPDDEPYKGWALGPSKQENVELK